MVFKNKNLFDYFVIFFISIVIIIVYIFSENLKEKRVDAIKTEKYNIYSNNTYSVIEQLIKNKQELTFSIALSLAQDSRIIKAIKENDISNINLKEFSKYLKKTTQLQNAWFHIVDAKGNSFYRSWVPKRGDSILKIRMDMAEMLKNPRIITTISTGKFDMTFKSLVPIYAQDKFIGVFEIITKFNSISKQLLDKDIENIVIVDKKYKKQIKKPFTKTFLEDYYIANLNAKKEFLSYIKDRGIENYIHSSKKYLLDEKNNHFIVIYNIPDIKGNPMGSIIAFQKLDSLNMNDIKAVEDNVVKYTAIVTLLLLLIGYYIVSRKHSNELDEKVIQRTKELEKEKQYIHTILDTNPNIIIVTNSFRIIDANKRFLKFFQYDSVDDFMKEHDCICDFFVTLDEKPFCDDKMVNGIPWAEYVANNKTEHIVQLNYNSHLFVFMVNAEYLSEHGDILLTFQNITEIKRKDKLLFEQSKLASMGEMIGNIAHQWRQPLSIVSSCATGMKLQKEFNSLSDEQFVQNCDLINENVQYLSTTIDDFKNFIKGDSEKTNFLLYKELDKLLNLISPSIKSHSIEFVTDVKEGIELYGSSSELLQCLINIYNNAKDALVEVPEDSRVFMISAKQVGKSVKISFQDSGLGIQENIIDKLFEPYFTTKHQKQGTGLGLHMTYNMIVHSMKGSIEAKNSKFTYKDKEYKGALFIITLPV